VTNEERSALEAEAASLIVPAVRIPRVLPVGILEVRHGR
jgi:hypothetical protein